jgi:hypothetical protein
MTHEMSHGLDYLALKKWAGDGGFSDTDIWRDAYKRDRASVSDYAKSSWAENFAEIGIVSIYDKLVDGGLKKFQKNWSDISNQTDIYKIFLGDKIVPGGVCRDRVSKDETVATGLKTRDLESRPNTAFTSDVNVITTNPKLNGLKIEHSH